MKEDNRQIAVNKIVTPDGTTLISKYRHDYVTYTDKNGQHYMVDGGIDYLRRGYDKPDYTEASLYLDSDIEELREFVERSGYGKDGKGKFRCVLLKDINDDWLDNIIIYEEENRPNNTYLSIYKKEKEYRKDL